MAQPTGFCSVILPRCRPQGFSPLSSEGVFEDDPEPEPDPEPDPESDVVFFMAALTKS
jgi:hypothetical protein